MELKHRQAMMQQQQMMMNYFSQMMLKQNSAAQTDANGKTTKVQRVIIVPVPAYSYGLNAGTHITGDGSSMQMMQHDQNHDHSTDAEKTGNVVEPVK